jgi:hypothetical protein
MRGHIKQPDIWDGVVTAYGTILDNFTLIIFYISQIYMPGSRSRRPKKVNRLWDWDGVSLCNAGVYCRKKYCTDPQTGLPYTHPRNAAGTHETKFKKREYTAACSSPGNPTVLNSKGIEMVQHYHDVCPPEDGPESDTTFWNNICYKIDNPRDLQQKAANYLACSNARKQYADECVKRPDGVNPALSHAELDPAHHTAQKIMETFGKQCLTKAKHLNKKKQSAISRKIKVKRSINNLAKSFKQRKQRRNSASKKITGAIRKYATRRRASNENWASQFRVPGSPRRSSSSRRSSGSRGSTSPKARGVRKRDSRMTRGRKN